MSSRPNPSLAWYPSHDSFRFEQQVAKETKIESPVTQELNDKRRISKEKYIKTKFSAGATPTQNISGKGPLRNVYIFHLWDNVS